MPYKGIIWLPTPWGEHVAFSSTSVPNRLSRLSFSLHAYQMRQNVSTGWCRKFIIFILIVASRWYSHSHFRPSLVAQRVKRLRAMLKTRVWTLGWEDPLEKEMATQSSTLIWKNPWTEEPSKLQSVESQRITHNWATFYKWGNEKSEIWNKLPKIMPPIHGKTEI